MMPGPELAALLERELACLRELRGVLGREYAALLAADVADLERVTGEKNSALGRQAQAARQRQQGIEQDGFQPAREDLARFFSRFDNCDQLLERQRELNDLAQQCHEFNRSNGRLIAQKQHLAQGALDILRQSDGSSPTYSGEGDAVDAPSSRLLGKA